MEGELYQFVSVSLSIEKVQKADKTRLSGLPKSRGGGLLPTTL